MEEFVAHRDKYNPGWGWWPADNRNEITNKFNDAKNWVKDRPNYFYQHIGNQWSLGTAFPVTINKGVTYMPETVSVNDIPLSEGVFDGKFFPNRQLTIVATAPEGKVVTGWKVVTTANSGSKSTKEYEGAELVMTPKSCKSIAIEAVLGETNGIEDIMAADVKQQTSDIYDLLGNKVATPQKGNIYIQNGKKIIWR
jgi:hypothetical protein